MRARIIHVMQSVFALGRAVLRVLGTTLMFLALALLILLISALCFGLALTVFYGIRKVADGHGYGWWFIGGGILAWIVLASIGGGGTSGGVGAGP